MSKKLDELIKDLSEPFPYDWRIQSRAGANKDKAVCTAFVDARTVQDILDAKCAKHNATWDVDYKELAGVIFCGITISIRDHDNQIISELSTRWDAGNRLEENTGDRLYVQGGKSAASDAFKRAAVMFGLGRFLYNIAPMILPCDQYNVLDDKGAKVYNLTEYIRTMGKKPASKRKKETPALAAAPSTPSPDYKAVKKLKKLTDSSFKAMQAAIESGNYEAVESVIDKYEVSTDQKTVLDTAIAAAKAKAALKPNESN